MTPSPKEENEMILAMNGLGDLIKIPFGYLLDWLYQFTTNYGLSLILFAIIIKLVLLPASIKSKKSTMKMSRISPRVQALQEKYYPLLNQISANSLSNMMIASLCI